jgi:hypothetical protein
MILSQIETAIETFLFSGKKPKAIHIGIIQIGQLRSLLGESYPAQPNMYNGIPIFHISESDCLEVI